MSTKKRKRVRPKQTGRPQDPGPRRRKRKKGMTPVKAALLFLLAIGLAFTAAAIFGDPTDSGRVWSEAHQHWHYTR